MNRHQIREKAFQLLFQLDVNDTDPEQALKDHLGEETIDPFLKQLIQGVTSNKEVIDTTIATHLENWTMDRIASVEKTILRLSLYEILFVDDIPASVSIDEAVELGHVYGDDGAGKFINGVLSKVIA